MTAHRFYLKVSYGFDRLAALMDACAYTLRAYASRSGARAIYRAANRRAA